MSLFNTVEFTFNLNIKLAHTTPLHFQYEHRILSQQRICKSKIQNPESRYWILDWVSKAKQSDQIKY